MRRGRRCKGRLKEQRVRIADAPDKSVFMRVLIFTIMPRILTEAEIILKLPDFRWTLERYHAAIEAGILTEYDKVELLFGKLVPTSPVGIAHGKVVEKLIAYSSRDFPKRIILLVCRIQ